MEFKRFKNIKTGQIHGFLKDGTQDHLITSDHVPVSLDEANTIINEMHDKIRQEALSKMTYADKRAAEYPQITEYLDAVVKGDQAAIQRYIDACKAVKAKYPKP